MYVFGYHCWVYHTVCFKFSVTEPCYFLQKARRVDPFMMVFTYVSKGWLYIPWFLRFRDLLWFSLKQVHDIHNWASIIWRVVPPVCSYPMAHVLSNGVRDSRGHMLYEVTSSGDSFWGMGLFFHSAEKHFFLRVGKVQCMNVKSRKREATIEK